jgi:hypothetical protein
MKTLSSRQRPSATAMRRSPRATVLTMAIAATAYLTAPTPSSAMMINYTFDHGTSACFSCTTGGPIVDISGSFTIDTGAVPGPFPAVNIMLTPDFVFNTNLPATLTEGNGGLQVFDADNGSGGTVDAQISFKQPLAETHDDLETFLLTVADPIPINPPFKEFADSVTGGVTPTPAPEPTSLTLLGGAIGLFFLRRRRILSRTSSAPSRSWIAAE